MKKLPIEKCQQGELDILIKVDEICNKLGLRYYLFYGTLIGAIRHRGFIPWDDDLDIMMPRPDYTKMVNYFQSNKDKLYPLKAVYVWHKEEYSYAMTRITDMTYKLCFTENGPFSKEDMGLFVDIYPYDGVGDNIEKALRIGKRSIFLEHWIKRAHDDFFTSTNNLLKKKIQPIVYNFAHHIGEDHYQNELINLADSFNYNNSKYIAPLTWHEAAYYFPRNWFEPSIEVGFCHYKFKAPKEYDKILRQSYGDYMQLPPKNERVASHYYDAFVRSEWEQENRKEE